MATTPRDFIERATREAEQAAEQLSASHAAASAAEIQWREDVLAELRKVNRLLETILEILNRPSG